MRRGKGWGLGAVLAAALVAACGGGGGARRASTGDTLRFPFAEQGKSLGWRPFGEVPVFTATPAGLRYRFKGTYSGIVFEGAVQAGGVDVVECDLSFRGAQAAKVSLVWRCEGDGAKRIDELVRAGRFCKSTEHVPGDGTPVSTRIFVGDRPRWEGTVRALYLLVKTSGRTGEVRLRRITLGRMDAAARLGRDSVSGETRAKIREETRPVLLALPPSRISRHLHVPPAGVLEAGFGILEPAWNRIRFPVEFSIRVSRAGEGGHGGGGGGGIAARFRKRIDPGRRPEDRRWFDVSLDLSREAGREVEILFETTTPTAPAGLDPERERLYAVWTDPRILERAGGGGDEGAAEGTRRPPSLILVSLDTLRADRLSCYGFPLPTSPVLDALARGGAQFETCISQAPETLPSHRTIMTGTYPSRHRGTSFFGVRARTDLPVIAGILRERGYATAAFTEGGGVSSHYGFDRGFDRYDNGPQRLSERRGSRPREAFSFGRRTFERAVEWLRGDADRPFFLFVHTYEVHTPYAPEPPLDRIFDPDYRGPVGPIFFHDLLPEIESHGKAPRPEDLARIRSLYDGGVRGADRLVGRLLAALGETGRARDTLVVVVSDHGEDLGDHMAMARHGHTLYEELLRVPLILSMPGTVPAGIRITAPVALVDLAPTILDLLGVPVPATMEGRSLRGALLGGGGDPALEERPIYSEDFTGARRVAVRTPRWKGIFTKMDGRARRADPRVTGLSPAEAELLGRPVEIFDLGKDPRERRNLGARTRPGRGPAAREETRLAALMRGFRAANSRGILLDLRCGENPVEVEVALEGVRILYVEQIPWAAPRERTSLEGKRCRLELSLEAGARRLVALQPARPVATLRLRLGAGGRALGAAAIRLGAGEDAPETSGPWMVLDAARLAIDPARDLRSLPPPPDPRPVSCRVMLRRFSFDAALPEERLDEGTYDRLRALGYVEDE